MKTDNWKRLGNRVTEDKYLFAYWQAVGGRIYAEVPVGRSGTGRPWPEGSKIRRIDGVRVVGPKEVDASSELKTFDGDCEDEFRAVIASARVEVIEVKPNLNRPVIGQAIAGAKMLEMEYGVVSALKTIVYHRGDPALELVCSRLGIKIHQANEVP